MQMAAYLLYIKTRTLLAAEEEVTELEQLMSSLEQLKAKDAHEAVKTVLPALSELSAQGMLLWTRPQEPVAPAAKVYDYRHEGADLLRALYTVFSRSDAKLPGPPELRALAPKRIVYGVRDKSREIIRILSEGPTTLRALYEAGHSRSEVVATFLSVLELCSMGSVLISEEEGEQLLTFAGGDTESIIEAIEE